MLDPPRKDILLECALAAHGTLYYLVMHTHAHTLSHTQRLYRGSKKELASVYVATNRLTSCLQFTSWSGRPKEMEQLKHTFAI